MKFGEYLRDKSVFITAGLLCACFSATLLYSVNASIYFALFIPSVFIISCAVALVIDYTGKRHYYSQVSEILAQLDEKRFLLEVIERPHTLEGKIWFDILKAATRSMNNAVARQNNEANDYREYIEMWVHEVKTPLAGMKLTLENHHAKTLLFEVDKLERLVNQALYYARSGSVETDYLIRQTSLPELVNSVLRDNARYLIQRKVSVEFGNLNFKVLADAKWLQFIFGQLIDNSVKYGSDKLIFSATKKSKSVTLTMEDNGAGIAPEDLPRIFDKGFTGANGRRFGKSTGMGLYLCRKLCKKMGLKFEIDSKLGVGTTAKITLPTKN
jgi:signal transduction histidine kinase